MTKRMTDRVAANSYLFSFGERGLLVQFNETEKTPAIRAVTTLNQQLLALKLRGLISTTPSYASLLVTFEPAAISGDRLSKIISELLQSPSSDAMNLGPEIDQACWQLPTLFADNCDEDARATGRIRAFLGSSHHNILQRRIPCKRHRISTRLHLSWRPVRSALLSASRGAKDSYTGLFRGYCR